MFATAAYNAGLFVAVCVGEGLGIFLFSYQSGGLNEADSTAAAEKMLSEASCH